jgi:adenylate kinase
MKLILIAPSGGGKGSLADLIVRDFGIPNISTGDIFRKNIKEQTPLGIKAEEFVAKGAWVPDELTIEMLLDRIKYSDCKNGFILDGFPRTLNQAKALAKKVAIDAVIELDITDELVINRLAGRFMCKNCKYIWNTRFPGFKAEACATCNGELYQRDDDKEEFIARRLAQYREANKDILDFYRKKGLLFSVEIQPEFMPNDTYKIVSEFFKQKGFK